MRNKIILWSILLSLGLILLTACASGNQPANQEIFTLKNQHGEDVTLIGEKPTFLFFFTTYT